MSDNIIGSKIRELRLSQGKNIVEFGELVEWPTSKVSKVENGKQVPTIEELKAISAKLNIPASNLIGENLNRLQAYQEEIQDTLNTKFVQAANMYSAEDRDEFKGASVGSVVTKDIPVLLTRKANINTERYLITGSIGKGQYAEIPWISIFNKQITESATKGIYIVYLYTADMQGLYLSLNQGFTYFKEKFGAREGKEEIEKMATHLRKQIHIPESLKTFNIDLKAGKPLGKGYMAGHIIGKYYDLANIPEDEVLVSDLLDAIEAYNEIYSKIANRTPEKFYDYIVELGRGKVTEDVELGTIEASANEENENYTDKPEDRQAPVVDGGGKKVYLRDPKKSAVAISQADYKCEADSAHYSFKARGTNRMFVEAHHLIPISKGEQFGYSIDIPANIVSLCPNCHKCIHLGEDKDKEILLNKLYDERKDRLEAAGIFVSFEQLKKFYNLG